MNSKGFKNLFKKQWEERDKCIERIVESTHPKKIIVSGPGTGKTYSFQQLLKRKKGKYLALTFINNLADKLRKDLQGLAESYTLHSFCQRLLHRIEREGIDDKFILFPKLELIIKSDARILYNKEPDFRRDFQQLNCKSKNIPFFLKRSDYYNTVSFDDSVFRVLKYFRKHPDEIPKYEQIVVDEYQDFNKLEVEFINILEQRNPILIVGDDDQALYTQLKYASPKYIREKFNDPKYEKFPLPFCSRCTQVVIDAIEDIVSQAKRFDKLKERVDKRYTCFLPDKRLDNKKYSKIIYAHCSTQTEKAPYIGKFIEQEIDQLPLEEIKEANSKGDYTVLITGPKRYLKQIKSYLEDREEYVLHYRTLEPEPRTIKIIDGYKILLKNKFSNLGWRVLLKCDPVKQTKSLLEKTVKDNKTQIYTYLPKHFIKKHKTTLQILKELKNKSEVTKNQKNILEKLFKIKIEELKRELKEDEKTEKTIKEESLPLDKISILLTTYVSCKGVSAGFVFILGLNEGNLPKSNLNPSDMEICKFIVALARTIKKCYLISTYRFAGRQEGNRSIFVDWINEKRVKYEEVNAKYWKDKQT